MGLMLPAFFMAMYEKDGLTAEKILFNIIRSRWFFPPKRPYKTENFYSTIEKEGRIFECNGQPQDQEASTARKAAESKYAAAGGKQKSRKKVTQQHKK